MPQSYFHVCSTRLAAGSTIEAGNWGAVIQKFGMRHTAALRESVLEFVRSVEFSQLPSRMRSSFFLPNLDTAMMYRDRAAGGIGWVYEVELTDPNALLHKADWNAVNPWGEASVEWAKAYWRGQFAPAAFPPPPVQTLEILAESDLRVRQRFEH